MPGQFDEIKRRVKDEIGSRRHSPLRSPEGDRFDKLTERARKVLRLAQEEAQRLHHNYMGTEHLLLGLVRERDGIAGVVLTRLGVELEDVRHRVEHIIGQGDHVVTGAVGMTPRAKKVMELAVDEARRMGHHYIGTEHILLGLVREGEGIAAGVLESMGLRLELVRGAVVQELQEVALQELARRGTPEDVMRGAAEPRTPEPSGPKNNVVTCRLDDRAVEALDALVEAGIRTTRSDAAAWLIAAGIEAHRPLFDRVRATIEEIRRLRAEAQQIAQQVSLEVSLEASQQAPRETQAADAGAAPEAAREGEGDASDAGSDVPEEHGESDPSAS